jgi:diadenosine tetraphosphate (Ap4A) HIT family hydrolase
MEFCLNERLAAGSFEVTQLHRCRVLLKNEAHFPWFIIVPEVPDSVQDLHHLDSEMFVHVMSLARNISEFVETYFEVEKLNVASIGNIVRQMHIHVVGRSNKDAAWPGVVWAFEGKQKYDAQTASEIIAAAKSFLGRIS